MPAERFPAVGKAPAALRPRERKHWLTQDAAAFSLLMKELPKGAKVSELRIDEGEINVTIDWKTPAFNDRPPVPYGEKTFDECGIAHMDYWYPRESPGLAARPDCRSRRSTRPTGWRRRSAARGR